MLLCISVKKLKVSDMVGAATQFDSVDKVMRAGVHIVSRRGKKERRVTRTVQKRVESRTGRIVSRLLHPDNFADWLDGFAGMQSRTPKSVFMVPTAKEREDLMSMFWQKVARPVVNNDLWSNNNNNNNDLYILAPLDKQRYYSYQRKERERFKFQKKTHTTKIQINQ